MKGYDWCKVVALGCLLVAGCVGGGGGKAGPVSTYDQLYMKSDVQSRWSTWENPFGIKGEGGKARAGRKGSAMFPLKAGESKVIAEVVNQSGTVRRIWMTMYDKSAVMMRGMRLDFYWDGADRPAVSVPIGDFFGQGLGQMASFESALFCNPEGRNFISYVPMPFKKGMKVVVTNETEVDQRQFWYEIDYTLGDRHGDDMLYFHAHWRRENPTKLKEDYEILPLVEGSGRYLGASVGVIANQQEYMHTWWGEGEVKIYLDGDRSYPTLCGTGAEDYIGTAYGLGKFSHQYQGCPLADWTKLRYCFYRLHIPDPIFFEKDVRVVIQQIGGGAEEFQKEFIEKGTVLYETGEGLKPRDLQNNPAGLFERCDDYSSCAYFYLDRPMNNLPELAPLGQRLGGLAD